MIANGEDKPQKGYVGRLAGRSGGFARLRVSRRSAPLALGREEKIETDGVPGAANNTGDGACAQKISLFENSHR